MAHPKRKEWALDLEQKLKSQGAIVDITWDKINRQWETAERALLKGTESHWHIVLEDDAIIGDNFYQNALKAISAVPEQSLISFYVGTHKPFGGQVTKAVEKAKNEGASWLSFRRLNWGVGIAIKGNHIIPMLEKARRSHLPYDEKIGLYYKSLYRKVYYTFPSIVDHRDEPSINKNTPKGKRVAHLYTDELIDFNDIVVQI